MKSKKTVGYIWYNPDAGLYQSGTRDEYWACYATSTQRQQCSLILELTNKSDILESKLVQELNMATDQIGSTQLRAVG